MLNSRRRDSQTQVPPPLKVYDILLYACNNFDVDALRSWKDRTNVLNNIPPFSAIVENNNLHNNCDMYFQTRILKLSYSNLAKYFG